MSMPDRPERRSPFAAPLFPVVLAVAGMRFDTGVSTEYFRNFFAARTPGHPDLLPDDISPVNVLSLVENAYLGTDFPMATTRRGRPRTTSCSGWSGGFLTRNERPLP
jgi:hypothetical protein